MRVAGGLLGVAVLVTLAGCLSWRPATPPPRSDTSWTLRVHLTDGSSTKVTDAVVWPDSIVARPWGAPAEKRVTFLRAEIRAVEAGRVDAFKSTLAALGIVVGVLAVAVGLFALALNRYGLST